MLEVMRECDGDELGGERGREENDEHLYGSNCSQGGRSLL